MYCCDSNVVVINSILWGNLPQQLSTASGQLPKVTYSDVKDGWPDTGNIHNDPLFIQPGYWDANDLWIDGDYHLQPNSPCIDAGDPNTPVGDEPEPNGNRINMGAYGGTTQASMSPTSTD